MRLIFTTLIIAIIALPAAAAFRAINRLIVVPISADTFEVIEDRGAGASDIWCAAADYARSAGLDGVRVRLYILEPRGPSRTSINAIGVVFTTNPDDALRETPKSYSVSVKRKGENLPIGHAYEFCETVVDDLFRLF